MHRFCKGGERIILVNTVVSKGYCLLVCDAMQFGTIYQPTSCTGREKCHSYKCQNLKLTQQLLFIWLCYSTVSTAEEDHRHVWQKNQCSLLDSNQGTLCNMLLYQLCCSVCWPRKNTMLNLQCPCPCLKTYTGSSSTVPFIPNLGTGWRSVAYFMSKSLDFWGKNPLAPFEYEAGRATEPVWMFWKTEHSPAPARNQTLDWAAHSLGDAPTMLWWLLN